MTQRPVAPWPSMPEAEATGATNTMYEDVKAVTGGPVVHLLFRHIATFPGCLEWSWEVLRPLYARGAIATYATHLLDDLETPTVPRLPHATLRAVGVDTLGASAINRILDAYNRSNPMNLVALTTLLAYLARAAAPFASTWPASALRQTCPDVGRASRAGPPEPPWFSDHATTRGKAPTRIANRSIGVYLYSDRGNVASRQNSTRGAAMRLTMRVLTSARAAMLEDKGDLP